MHINPYIIKIGRIKILSPIILTIILTSIIGIKTLGQGAAQNSAGESINQIEFLNSEQLYLISSQSPPFSQLTGLQLTTPSGGESWRFGSLPRIEWNVGIGITNVKLEYSTNNGINWITITSSTANDGQYLWETMPNLSTSNARVKVSSTSSSESDSSDNVFTINSISANIFVSPVKILPLGNSLTFDNASILDFPNPRSLGDRKSYRFGLFNLLSANNYNFNFVGGEPAGFNFFDDFQTAGFPGNTTSQIYSILSNGFNPNTQNQETPSSQPYLNYYSSDIILLHAGTNAPRSVTDMQNILNQIDTYSYNTWVILALILNTDANIPAYNEAIRTMANGRINSVNPDRIIIVNMQDILSPTDFLDSVHPNDIGYQKMAAAWYSKLQYLLDSSSNYIPKIKSNPKTSAAVGQLFSYDVSSTGRPSPRFSLLSAPAGMSIDSISGVITWTPTFPGIYNISVKSENSQGQAIQNFSLNVVSYPLGMTHYWKLEEEFGFPYYDSYGINVGSETRFPSTMINGKVGNAQDFDRDEIIDGLTDAGNRITIRDDNTFDWNANSSFSIEFWIKRDQNPGATEEVVIGRGLATNGTQSRWWVSVTPDRRIKFHLKDSLANALTVQTGTNLINTGNWYHVAAIRNGITDSIKIFINGVQRASSIFNFAGGFSNDLPITIGSLRNSESTDKSSAYTYDGIIDEVALYDKALDSTEVVLHYNLGLSGKGYENAPVTANIKVFLEGPYNSGTMSTNLNLYSYIPTIQPFSSSPWNYSGNETVSSNFFVNNPNIVDWILLEVRSDSVSVVKSRAAFIKSDGSIVDIDGNSPVILTGIAAGNYFVVIKHRNHLSVMSSTKLALSSSSALYDFTTSQAQAYSSGSNPMIDLGDGKFGMLACDANYDDIITSLDFDIYISAFRSAASGYQIADWNLDGIVTSLDFDLFIINFRNGSAAQVP